MVKMTNRRIRLGIDWVLKKGETVDRVANNFLRLLIGETKYEG